ncbi:MAG: ATP-dependent DNA helicase [Patescibacteria group bacterium]
MLTSEFKRAYKALNKEQKEAVEAIEGPVLVVAGPGTGKTQVLTLRIANILLKTDTQAENILALTFTDSATQNLRRRLTGLIGSRAYRVVIETFHGFCNNIIKNYPEYFPNITGSTHATEVETIAILEEIITRLPLSILRPWGDQNYYLREIATKIEELKREGVEPTEYIKIIKVEEKNLKTKIVRTKAEQIKLEKRLLKNKELYKIYTEYQNVLVNEKLYDWSDMIVEVLKVLQVKNKKSKPNNLKIILQENYQYVLVDEHQDTNNAQNKILEILLDYHQNPNIFIVGDEKQAIFRFQGASIENFSYFKEIYPEAKLIELSKNYRSNQPLLDAAHSLISSPTPLVSRIPLDTGQASIKIAEFRNKNTESHFVAEQIKALIQNNKIKTEEIAVIYRTNREAFEIAEALQKNGVKYIIESDETLLNDKFVRMFLAILETIDNYGDDAYLIPALHLREFGFDPLHIYKTMRMAEKEKKLLYELIEKEKNFREFSLKLKNWFRHSKEENAINFLERVLRESGILESIIKSRDALALLGIEKLFEEAKRISLDRSGATLDNFMRYLSIVKKHNLFIKKPKNHAQIGAVRLMTAHRTKGQEFTRVFIINANEKSFGSKQNREILPLLPAVYSRDMSRGVLDGSHEDDERRLFYVALTRAKAEVVISYSIFDENGREILPSPFIEEIRNDRKEIMDTTKFQEKLDKSPQILFAKSMTDTTRKIDKQFVSQLFRNEPLSVTALNNYLDCPWKYFYRNLLRIPSAPEKHQVYGSAMHAAVNDLWRILKERKVGESFLLNSYKKHLAKSRILSTEEKKEAQKRGIDALKNWFRWVKPRIEHPLVTEFNIKSVPLNKNILLSGKLDKVEFISPKKAIVTDYKTGKPRSRNYIEGLTQDSKGDMKRQLIFYKLILDLHAGIKMEKGIIEFLEASSKEECNITDIEVTNLKKLIEKTAQEITSLSFWNKTCDDKNCKYCGYRKLLEK